MLGDLEALQHVEAAPEVDRPAQIRGEKLICIDHQVFLFDEGPSTPITLAPAFRHMFSQAP